ncbi:MAG: SUMF1/EgtB/PvdO family nonheme iron enzyme [Bacteroidetes bacterium]|nr:SUMF1/EgtB/PvdO family nonheme iron enzyme [Bacteroidota bacterium]
MKIQRSHHRFKARTPLRNPVNDANAFAASLRAVGFTVIVKNNLNKTEMENAVRNYSQRLTAGDVALFYYSGHRMQVKGVNYLVPVGESIYSEVDIPYKSMEAQFVIDYMQEAKTSVNIIILDACRDNPFKSFRSLSRGFVPVIAPQGTFIAYSTAPGTVAFDGAGSHSPYTENLIASMKKPGMPIEEMFKEVRRNVMNETSKMQVPWESSSLIDAFAFNGVVNSKIVIPESTPPIVNKPLAKTANLHKDCNRLIYMADRSLSDKEYFNARENYQKASLIEPGESYPKDKIREIDILLAKNLDLFTTMVFVEGGTFQMGSNDGYDNEKPVHSVTLNNFYIGKTEVTQKQWREVMGSDPPELNNKGCDQCPVEGVSWIDVQDFITKLNRKTNKTYRLPTEAEWEYAARGGNKSRGYAYSGSTNVGDVAWYSENSGLITHPVGQKEPNELGIYDMTGNVWEWCRDWYGAYEYDWNSTISNPQGPSSGSDHVFRGGGWGIGPQYCRTSYRNGAAPDYRSYYLGFRFFFPIVRGRLFGHSF